MISALDKSDPMIKYFVLPDDILEMNDMNPSHTRLHSGEWEAAVKREEDAVKK